MKHWFCALGLLVLPFYGFSQFKCVKGDCVNGHGVALFTSGARYEGDFLNGRIHGLGALTFPNGDQYIGNWQNQYRQGRGRFKFVSGDEYLGEFVQNQMEGTGVMTYANGNKYDGQWKANNPNGKGVLTLADGARYEGFFVAGAIEGEGIMVYKDGSRYEGSWKAGRRNGFGVYWDTQKRELRGLWADDVFVGGQGQDAIALGNDSVGLRNCNWAYCASGLGEFTYRNGVRYVGEFVNGQPEGMGKAYYQNGDHYEGGWKRNAPQGRGVMYYAEGRIVGADWESGQVAKVIFEEKTPQGFKPPTPPAGVNGGTDYKGIRIWAVVVGVAEYKHMPRLRYTDDDAYQLYAFLRSPQGGALPEDRIRLLIDEDATRDAILKALRELNQKADQNDVIIFYFSGHGIQGSFLPVDYDGYNNRLLHEEVRDLLASSRARHKILIADACHAGSFPGVRAPLHLILEKYYEAFEKSAAGTALLLSSKGDEYSLEDAGLRSGIYSHFIIKGIKGGADRDHNGLITVGEIHDYVNSNVRQYTANVQNPLLLGNFDRNMPFAVVR